MSGPRRELVYWHALVTALGEEGQREAVTPAMQELTDALGLPRLVLDERASMAQIVRRQPELGPLLRVPDEDHDAPPDEQLKRAILFLKNVRNVFSPPADAQVSASSYNDWLTDVRMFEGACGYAPGGLRQGGGPGRSATGSGGGPAASTGDVEDALGQIAAGQGLMSEPELKANLEGIEKSLIDRMALREVLADAELAKKLKPSMALTEQLLRDKDNLSPAALGRAKGLIKQFVEELGEILLKEVERSSTGTFDRHRPPKRTFRNLDLKRTIWANLKNWDPQGEQLMVDRLYYRRHVTKKQDKTRMIVVVDQSGSMVPAMVNCTILASIFAGLPYVLPHLIAYDTQALDLSDWVTDPFEVLLRTKLGGGTDGMCAVPFVQGHVTDPAKTVIVWISDFYDNRELLPVFRTWKQSGITFLPVGSVSTSGYFSVDGWFRTELKALGTPILSGSLKTLIRELKAVL